MVILRARITFVNISSQIVHRFGFMRLGLMPNTRNGADSTPRSGTGTRICCQHPLQILACGCVTGDVLPVTWTIARELTRFFALAPRVDWQRRPYQLTRRPPEPA